MSLEHDPVQRASTPMGRGLVSPLACSKSSSWASNNKRVQHDAYIWRGATQLRNTHTVIDIVRLSISMKKKKKGILAKDEKKDLMSYIS